MLFGMGLLQFSLYSKRSWCVKDVGLEELALVSHGRSMSEGWEGADDPSLLARVEKSEHYRIESLENTIVNRKVLVVLGSAMANAMRLSEIFVSVRAKHFREAREWAGLGLQELGRVGASSIIEWLCVISFPQYLNSM